MSTYSRWDPIEAGRPVSTVVLFMYTPKRHIAQYRVNGGMGAL